MEERRLGVSLPKVPHLREGNRERGFAEIPSRRCETFGREDVHRPEKDGGMIDYAVSDGVCVLRLNSPPVNTLTYALLDELRAAIRRANSDAQASGIVITGDSSHFSAGADVNIFRAITRAEEAVKSSRVFQEAFQEVEDSQKPVAAAVAGRMMGSAIELAMACHVRVCAQGTTFSMPEVNLGINPGAGGTGRLPRLVGAEAALRMLLTGEAIEAEEALALGLVDAVCGGGELVERAKGLLQLAPRPRNVGQASCLPVQALQAGSLHHTERKTRERKDKVADRAANDAAFRMATELLAKARPEIIAPFKIAEAVKVGLEESFEAGLLKEQEIVAECMATRATQNKIYLFFATRETAKVPQLAGVGAAEVAKAAVVGMGTMGTGIAQALLMAGFPVVVRDAEDSAVRRGKERIRSSIQKRVEQGKLSQEGAQAMLGRLSAAAGWQEIADADLVIEAVFEDVEVKRAVIRGIEDACAADALIASNTSTLSLDVLAEGMRHPERLIGMHFFNPAHRMPLVEIIRRDGTPDRVVATALRVAKAMRKTPVVVKNREGFLVNRIFIPYFKEAFWLLEDGAAPAAVDAAMVEFGFPMGPLALIDMAGLDILMHTDRVLSRAFPRHGALSPIVSRLVEQGHLGQKTGSGVYRYERGDYTPRRSETAEQLVAAVRQEKAARPYALRGGGKSDAPASSSLWPRERPVLRPHAERRDEHDEIADRLVLRMVSEALYVLEEGIALRESDIDAAMVLGTGFPDFRGGVLRYARDLGLGCVLAQLEKLAGSLGERFSPPQLLREMKGAQ